MNTKTTLESVKGKIGTIVRKHDDEKYIKKVWTENSDNKYVHIYKAQNLADDDYNDITDSIAKMRKATSFSEYSRAFEKLCKVTKIPDKECIIERYKFKRDKFKNYVEIRYANSPRKIIIPKGSKLIHKSMDPNLEELKPFFKGKVQRNYLYSSERIYFTIKEGMTKLAVDVKAKDKLYTYVAKENITTAWIDPLLKQYSFGAVYVTTSSPIKVERLDKLIEKENKKDDVKKESVDLDEETFTEDTTPFFASLDEFMEFYGLEYADDDVDEDVYDEGVKEIVQELLGKRKKDKEFKKHWEDSSNDMNNGNYRKLEFKSNPNLKDVVKKLKETISTTENYSVYKKAYGAICDLFKVPKTSTIAHLDIDDNNAKLDYRHAGAKRVIIPNDITLLHVSPVGDIDELKPTFRSKVKGKYLYPSKRVFFTVGKKKIPASKAGLENAKLYKYTPREEIRTAWIDPSCIDYKTGAIYVDTDYPIPVKKIEDDDKKLLNKFKKESVEDLKLSIYESYANNEIDIEERNLLLDLL